MQSCTGRAEEPELDFEVLCLRNPRIVHAAASGHGPKGEVDPSPGQDRGNVEVGFCCSQEAW